MSQKHCRYCSQTGHIDLECPHYLSAGPPSASPTPGIGGLADLLKSAAQGMIDEAAIDRGSKWIEAMKAQTPFAHAILMGLLYQTPEAVLDAAANFNSALAPYRRNEYALTYIRELQKKLRGNK